MCDIYLDYFMQISQGLPALGQEYFPQPYILHLDHWKNTISLFAALFSISNTYLGINVFFSDQHLAKNLETFSNYIKNKCDCI